MAREPDPIPPIRVLIVDAYGHSREGLCASLRGGGWTVDTAAGSREGVQKTKDGRFDVAIIDLDLPPSHGVAVSGWELARIFRAFHPTAAVVLVTADRRPELQAEADQLPRCRLVEKPIIPSVLRGLVRALGSEPVARTDTP